MKKIIILLLSIATTFTSFAQKAKENSNPKEGTVFYTYSCPIHPDIKSDKPGKCSSCGMDLVLSKKEILKREVVNQYTCPMHGTVISDKPGKCSECGSELALSKKEILKRKELKLFTCPMHPGEVCEKSGKCPKCGMELTELKPKEEVKKD